MNDEHRQELLRSSAAYATARLSFANPIVIAQRAGAASRCSRSVDAFSRAGRPAG